MVDETLVAATPRAAVLQRGIRLEYVTVGWNLVEGAISMAAAAASGSVALLGFGLDSFVESASGTVLIWRLRAERAGMEPEAIERLEHRAQRLVAVSLFGLAAFIAVRAAVALAQQEHPEASPLGIAVTSLSIAVMWWLARTKRRTAIALGSRALEADSFQTTACWWLSIVTLVGIGLNALFGWWWADPTAALGITFLIAREGREVWQGDDCCEV
jgi:divalent metal cation (Fe/Co/Zn/Cd) transporter